MTPKTSAPTISGASPKPGTSGRSNGTQPATAQTASNGDSPAASDFRLRDEITRALSRAKTAGPENVARKLMASWDTEQRDAALAQCLADRVRIEITRARLGDQVDLDAQLTNAAGSRREGPSKWQVPAQAYVPDEGWKFEIDLTVADLRAVAAEYGARAEQMAAKQQLYAQRADELERSGFATWGEYLASQTEQAA